MAISVTPHPLVLPNKNIVSCQQPPSKKPDPAISLLQICKKVEELAQIHTLLIKTSLIREKHAFGRLLLSFTSFDNPGNLDYARKLFDTIDFHRNSFIYNTMIRGYSNCGNPKEAFAIYSRMLCEDSVYPDDFTFTFVFSACSKLQAAFEGKQAHAQMIKCPFKFGTQSWNSLMDFYAKIGEIGSAGRRLFDGIEEPDVVSWNCLLDGYVKLGELGEARKVFEEMPQRDIVSWTTMLVGYVNAGLLGEASHLFNKMPERNVISWSALISGYVQMGSYTKALNLFKEMQVAEIEMDRVTMTTVLSACASIGALDQGRWIHAYVDRHGIKVDAHLSTALIDMYCKCGQIDIASKVFREAADKKVFMWNAMLGGLAMHSFGEEAVELFSKMIGCGIEPNEITFICILAACNHSGLVNDGLRIFNSMVVDHDVQPLIEHYGCLVDLLGRSGFLYDALQVIETMPMKAGGNELRALLGACKLHSNLELGEQVGRILIDIEPLNDVNYVLLSNIYAMDNRWENVRMLRREMKVKGLVKTPGCSSIESNGIVHEFVAGDLSHPRSREISDLLNKMNNHMALQGYEP
ncbi:hypothetical protein L1049_016494 [Liquidambar formosana]|uniref:Chlororespiratory reduction 4 n=1 Tax=Liquidambar formosana TaxID=63359 RepID=A0AAP0RZF8_LIQFO